MPLQNRVTPFGEIVAVQGRGTMLGNRGVLHDDRRTIVRPWQVRRWIACRLTYGERRRTLMRPRSWTELFFLDEATAFAAGHRPCAECRRPAYRRFQELWIAAHGEPANADTLDARLGAERREGTRKRTYRAELTTLPDGTYVALESRAWLVWEGELLAWSDAGYVEHRPRPTNAAVDVLTPRAIVAVFGLGYRPEVHPSATAR